MEKFLKMNYVNKIDRDFKLIKKINDNNKQFLIVPKITYSFFIKKFIWLLYSATDTFLLKCGNYKKLWKIILINKILKMF